jgi:hypothetical protein
MNIIKINSMSDELIQAIAPNQTVKNTCFTVRYCESEKTIDFARNIEELKKYPDGVIMATTYIFTDSNICIAFKRYERKNKALSASIAAYFESKREFFLTATKQEIKEALSAAGL